MKFLTTRPVLVLAAIALAMTGCKGPAQKVGEGIDDAAGQVRDAVTRPGPVEQTGRAIDKAVGR